MNARVCREFLDEAQDMRVSYCEIMLWLAEQNSDIVALDADLMSPMGMKPFAQRFPRRNVDCGIQEANMIGVACGMSAVGYIPFAHTFAQFMSRRACDQVYMSGAYAKMNVKLVGSDPGITAQLNGGTHMPFDDMGIMRGIPGMTVLEPTDSTMLKSIMPQVAAQYGMTYIRLVCKAVKKVYEDVASFELGKAVTVREGTDATVIASGFCVSEAAEAADMLAREGVSVRVLDMFTWKPLDTSAVLLAARETGAVVTAENHSVLTGLSAAVSGALLQGCPVPMEFVGVRDLFGEVGKLDYLSERFGLKSHHIMDAVRKVIARKHIRA